MVSVAQREVRIAASVLSADFLHYAESLRAVADGGADAIHFDVMDGHFVPNLSIGFPILDATLAGTDLPVDVHLMVTNPDFWAPRFARPGVTLVTVHPTLCLHAHSVVTAIRDAGADAGLAIDPGTPLSAVEELLPFVQNLLVMTINPGFGGQTLIPEMVGKVRRARELVDRLNPPCRIQVDGGVSLETIRTLHDAGATDFVAGSAVFAPGTSPAANVRALRAAATGD